MSSSRANRSSSAGAGGDSQNVDELSEGVANVHLDSVQDNCGEWEVYAKKSKNKNGSSATRPWISPNPNSRAWGQPEFPQKQGLRTDGGSGRALGNTWSAQAADNTRKPAGRGRAFSPSANRMFEQGNVMSQPVIGAPLERGWNWQGKFCSSQGNFADPEAENDNDDEVDNDDVQDDVEEDDSDIGEFDDDLMSDGVDSDTSQKSLETRKRNHWFKKFFEILDSLSEKEINEPARQWHCPACQGGPGAIDWYRGLQPLTTHAKTVGAKRVKLHRELAELLEEELRRRGTSVVPSGEVIGKWKGLKEEEKDHDIIWPPMVLIMNTWLEKDDNEKWIGMGNQELLDCFNKYAAVKARHSYGPQGHRGMSVLIFECSPRGYLEAERLHKHFIEQGTDRYAWEHRRVLFHPGGKRQLYGFLPGNEDLDIFNKHSTGKSKLKYEIRSYHEMVVNQIRQMTEDNQQLVYLKGKVVKEQRHSKHLEESFSIVSEKLRKTVEENQIVRKRTQMQHEQNKEELDFQEQFFTDQMSIMHEEIKAKEEEFERLQQDKRAKMKQPSADSSTARDKKTSLEEIAKLIQLQDKEMEEFVAEREKLVQVHEEKLQEMKKRHWDEELDMEKEFNAKLTQLMGKYSPPQQAGQQIN